MKKSRAWFLLLLLVPIGLGIMRLHFDVDVLNLLPPQLPAVHGLKLYQQHFANSRELILTLETQSAEQTEGAARAIAQRLRSETGFVNSVMWEPPWLEHPDQMAELLGYLWLNQSPENLVDLSNRLSTANLDKTLQATREQLSTSLSPEDMIRSGYDPYGLTHLPESAMAAAPSFSQGQEMFASPDGKFRILFVQAKHDLPSYRECAAWLKQVHQSLESAPAAEKSQWSSAKMAMTGPPAFVAEIAGGMQHDIQYSVGGTAIIIAILFWFAHRRVKPMLWLLFLLAVILGATLALGGLIFGNISVVSMGFAAILLGLAVDYAVVHYQEALAHPGLAIPQIRKAIAPSIFWAAVTTISAFLVLNFGGLPGLAQLGSLVALGVALAAFIMIFAFLPPLFPGRWKMPPEANTEATTVDHSPTIVSSGRQTAVLIFSAVLLLACAGILLGGFPRMDATAQALQPRNSAAYGALEQIKNHLNEKREPLWLVIGGANEEEVGQRLKAAEAPLQNAVSNGVISSFMLPSQLWPQPQNQRANRDLLRHLAGERPLLHRAVLTNGFSDNSFALTDRILDTWQAASASDAVFWPTNPISRWIFDKVVARTSTNQFALGFLNPIGNAGTHETGLASLEKELPSDGVYLSGWELLGGAIFKSVKGNMWKLIAPMLFLVGLSLLLAFRRPREVLLSISVLLLSGLCLLSVMHLFHWSWNLLNLMALPLILGTGVDYSIFIQLGLRRYGGDLKMTHQAVGRALLLCGATAIAGFGSLAWSSNAGMSSLGAVCAVGIGGNMLISIYLLPWWWRACSRKDAAPVTERTDAAMVSVDSGGKPRKPSALYRAEFWKIGLWLVKALPAPACRSITIFLADCYWRVAGHRRRTVYENLLPVVRDERLAKEKTRELFRQFAIKLVDLWRYEAGLPIEELFGEYTGWEHFLKAREQKRGVLLVTPHLGNWEFGGPALSRKGVELQVVTLAEPGENFTELRQAARARWNIETFVIGDDPFAIVEVIRRLEAGASVALLADRPPAGKGVEITLFGKPFLGTLAVAELARASGCLVLPVYLPRVGNRYEAHVLRPIDYDRASLRDKGERKRFTQELLSVFEPVIAQHIDQWFHFVPVWPESAPRAVPVLGMRPAQESNL